MPQDAPSTETRRPARQLPRVAPFTEWERAVLGLDAQDDLDNDAETQSPLSGANRDHEAWPFGLAAQVFLQADALTTALVSAQQAHVIAKSCCLPCVAWTLALQARAHRALSEELAKQAARMTKPPAPHPISSEVE